MSSVRPEGVDISALMSSVKILLISTVMYLSYDSKQIIPCIMYNIDIYYIYIYVWVYTVYLYFCNSDNIVNGYIFSIDIYVSPLCTADGG